MTGTPLFVRHGMPIDADSARHSHPDAGLTESGCRAAYRCGQSLREPQILLISSPLRRAQETAHWLARSVKSVQLLAHEPLFAEWAAPSMMLGRTASPDPPAYVEWRESRAVELTSSLPGGESLAAFAARARSANRVAATLAQGSDRRVVIISHRLLIGAVAALRSDPEIDAAALFTAARTFRLQYCETWVPTQIESTCND